MNPKLPMEPTIIAPPDVNIPNVNMAQYGDPLAKIGPPVERSGFRRRYRVGFRRRRGLGKRRWIWSR